MFYIIPSLLFDSSVGIVLWIVKRSAYGIYCGVHQIVFGKEETIEDKMNQLLEKEKRQDKLLIEAIALVNNPQVRLAILGHGPLEEKLYSLIESFGLHNQVILPGYQGNPYAWMAKADAFILSSHYEGFPNVVLEALSCGTQVIATPAPGGTQEILEPIVGCFISKEITAISLAKTISMYIDSEKKKISEKELVPYKPHTICEKYTSTFLS